MRPSTLVLGLTLLLVAAVMAVYTVDKPGTSSLPDSQRDARSLPQPSAPSHHARRSVPAGKSESARDPRLPVIETLHVEPYRLTHPAVEAQAARVETGARNRLEELTDDLDLTTRQQLEIFPLLARSHPDYSGNLRLVGVPDGPLDPLGRLAAERKIHKILDPDQLLELELKAIEADVWWTDVIARLEKDLRESTREPVATGTAPEHDPTPPKNDPPPPPAVVPPTPHRGNNLFDLLQEGES